MDGRPAPRLRETAERTREHDNASGAGSSALTWLTELFGTRLASDPARSATGIVLTHVAEIAQTRHCDPSELPREDCPELKVES